MDYILSEFFDIRDEPENLEIFWGKYGLRFSERGEIIYIFSPTKIFNLLEFVEVDRQEWL